MRSIIGVCSFAFDCFATRIPNGVELMSETKGKTPAPVPNEIITDVVNNAALTLYFDLSVEAWKRGDIFILDVKKPHLADTTYEFYVVFQKNVACYVGRTRTPADGYLVLPDRDNPYFAQELAMRDRVLDVALTHFTGKSHLPEETYRLQLAQELLEGNMTMAGDRRPIVRDELPGVFSPDQGETELHSERQWSVQIGTYHCAIGLFGTDDNGNPKLVPFSDKQ
jgi:hypothetical protein